MPPIRIGTLTVFVAPLLAGALIMVAGVESVTAGNPLSGVGLAWPVATFTGAYTAVTGRPGWALLSSRRNGMNLIGWAFAALLVAGALSAVGAVL